MTSRDEDGAMKHTSGWTGAALLAAAVPALFGCTGGSSPEGSKDPDTIRYMLAQPEEAKQLDSIKADVAEFEKASGIQVELDIVPADTLRTVLQTQLRSGQGPDVFTYDTGPGFAGALAEAGLVEPLDAAYAEHDWPIYDFAKQRVTFGGALTAIPNSIETLGLYYNQDLLDGLGIAPPSSLEELTAAAQAIKDSGAIPFAVSDKEGWQGGHLLSMILSSMVGSQGMEDLIDGTLSWDSPDVVAALEVIEDYNDRGFFPPSPAGVGYDNGNALFFSGEAAILPTGSWLVQSIDENAAFGVSYAPFPSPGSPGIYSGGLGSGLFVSKSSQKSDAAIEFLDHTVTPDYGRYSVETLQIIPAFPVDTTSVEGSPLWTQTIADASKIADGTADFGYNLDVVSSASFNEAMWNGVQAILSGQSTPEQIAARLQKDR